MVSCFAIGCSHRTCREKCSFFRFPNNYKKRAQWIRLCRRAGKEPGPHARLCSCHFVDNNKEQKPSIFKYNKGKKIEIDVPNVKRLKKSEPISSQNSAVPRPSYSQPFCTVPGPSSSQPFCTSSQDDSSVPGPPSSQDDCAVLLPSSSQDCAVLLPSSSQDNCAVPLPSSSQNEDPRPSYSQPFCTSSQDDSLVPGPPISQNDCEVLLPSSYQDNCAVPLPSSSQNEDPRPSYSQPFCTVPGPSSSQPFCTSSQDDSSVPGPPSSQNDCEVPLPSSSKDACAVLLLSSSQDDCAVPLPSSSQNDCSIISEPSNSQNESLLSTSFSSNYVVCLDAENMFLKEQVEELKTALKSQSGKFTFSQVSQNDKLVLMYTGLPNAAVFNVLLKYVQRLDFNYEYGWNVTLLTLEDQLFIMLQKLRQNYTFMDLAVRYNVSDTTIRNIFFTLLSVLHEGMYKAVMQKNVPSLMKIKEAMPCNEFPNCRFLIDCTEIYIENPRRDLEAQRQTYSHYKKRQTFKALVAVAPNGIICFTSKLYPGSISDKELFKESGLSDFLNPGDLIVADKGFLIHDLLPQGVSLNIPPFLMNPQFTKQEAKYTTKLARKRIHVERAIQRIKSFEILDCIPHQYQSSASKIFEVCVLLVNLQNPLLKA